MTASLQLCYPKTSSVLSKPLLVVTTNTVIILISTFVSNSDLDCFIVWRALLELREDCTEKWLQIHGRWLDCPSERVNVTWHRWCGINTGFDINQTTTSLRWKRPYIHRMILRGNIHVIQQILTITLKINWVTSLQIYPSHLSCRISTGTEEWV